MVYPIWYTENQHTGCLVTKILECPMSFLMATKRMNRIVQALKLKNICVDSTNQSPVDQLQPKKVLMVKVDQLLDSLIEIPTCLQGWGWVWGSRFQRINNTFFKLRLPPSFRYRPTNASKMDTLTPMNKSTHVLFGLILNLLVGVDSSPSIFKTNYTDPILHI